MVRGPATRAGHPGPGLDEPAADLAERRAGVLGRGRAGVEDGHPLRELGRRPRRSGRRGSPAPRGRPRRAPRTGAPRLRSTWTSIRSGLIERSIPPGGPSRWSSRRPTGGLRRARKSRAMSGSFAWTMKARSNSRSPQRTGRVPFGGCGVAARADRGQLEPEREAPAEPDDHPGPRRRRLPGDRRGQADPDGRPVVGEAHRRRVGEPPVLVPAPIPLGELAIGPIPPPRHPAERRRPEPDEQVERQGDQGQDEQLHHRRHDPIGPGLVRDAPPPQSKATAIARANATRPAPARAG